MLSRPEPQSFTKFLISAGVFLCVTAFVGPGFALRDTGVLRISRHELNGLTTTGRSELEHRQTIERDIGRVAPISAAVLLVGGLALIGSGLPRLRNQERLEDARSSAELDMLLAKLKPQTGEERRQRLEAEVTSETKPDAPEAEPNLSPPAASAPVASPPLTWPAPDAARSAAIDRVARMKRARDAEKLVIERIREIAPSGYKVFDQVMLADSNLGFDGLLVSVGDREASDVVVELKYSETVSAVRKSIRTWADATAGKLLRYQARTGRTAVAWLIAVVGEAVDADALAYEVAPTVDDLSGQVEASIVNVDDIHELASPIFVGGSAREQVS
jgi:hypothetical protein